MSPFRLSNEMPDEIDLKLMALLKRDGKKALKALSAEVGLSLSRVQERISKLESDGHILRYGAVIAPEFAHRAYMLVKTETRSCAVVAPLLTSIPEILRCDSVAGDVDMVLVVEATSPQRLQQVRDQIARVAGVIDIVTLNTMLTRFGGE